MTPPSDEVVVLSGGLSVPLAALRVLWALEDRGFDISVCSEARLHVRPGSKLTPDDDAAIRQFRDELIALVRACEAIQ
jgi:hypothetical protein